MDINRLRLFSAVIRTGNLRRAADLLHMTPGALSKSLSVLQGEIGFPLFERKGRGLIPTPFGNALFEKSQEVIEDFEGLLLWAKNGVESAPTTSIRIATFELFSSHIFAKFLGELSDKSFDVLLSEKTPGDIERSILLGESDYGLTTMPIPHEELEFLKVSQFSIGAYIRHDLTNSAKLSEVPFAAPITKISRNPTGEMELDGWPASIPRNVKYRFELLETALSLAGHGAAAVFCPDFVVKALNLRVKEEFKLSKIPTPKGFPVKLGSVYLVKRAQNPETPFVKKLSKFIRLFCK
jgi:DNA-binding transcriptional LysR family regulator